jgi:hypothetical protein
MKIYPRIPCLIKHHDVKTYGGMDSQLYALLNLTLGDEWSTSLPGRFTHRYLSDRRSVGPQNIPGWVKIRLPSENVKGNDHLGYLSVDGRIILK